MSPDARKQGCSHSARLPEVIAHPSGPALQARSTHAHAHAVANTKEKEERAHGGQKSIGNCCLKERPTAGKDTSDRLVTRGFRAFERPVPF